MSKPVVGITMGDPAGIGPEIISKALRHRQIHSICRPLVFGSSHFLTDPAFNAGHFPQGGIVQYQPGASFEKRTIYVVDVKGPRRISVGKRSAAAGKAAFDYLNRALQSAVSGDIDAMVTAPVSKATIRQAGVSKFIGHTEYLARVTRSYDFAMMFYSKQMKVALVTTHLPLRRVASSITSGKILRVISLSNKALKKLGCPRPHIGVAGINPHCGEGGAFGDEDTKIVVPAVGLARKKGIDAEGPVPADTLFRTACKGGYDLIVAMYHDQALAPFKMLAFDKGVNVTLGLPFVRTSVDHGTAFDIAGKGVASEKSLVEAIKLAVLLAK